jgi:hypothetical protein
MAALAEFYGETCAMGQKIIIWPACVIPSILYFICETPESLNLSL